MCWWKNMLENKGEKSMLVYILKDLNGLRGELLKCYARTYCDKSISPAALSFSSLLKYLSWYSVSLSLNRIKKRFFHAFCKKKRLNNVLYFSQRTANISTITGSLSGLYYLCCHQFWRRRLMQVSSSYFCHCFGRSIEQTASNWGQQKGCLVVFCLIKVTLKIRLINKITKSVFPVLCLYVLTYFAEYQQNM